MSNVVAPWVSHRPRATRTPTNPLDKSTVVSILPCRIEEWKRTLQPGRFILEAGSYEKPTVLVVGTSSWYKDIDPDQPLLEIPVSSIQIADSIIRDYCNGLLACDMSGSMPGLFFIPGEHNIVSIQRDHKNLLNKARDKQKNWYQALIKLGDALWARSNGNPLVISEDMKLAAHELQLKEKSWMKDNIYISEMINCPACGTMRNSNFPICHNCKVVVDKTAFEKLGLKYAV
jgi:hypothetical protein